MDYSKKIGKLILQMLIIVAVFVMLNLLYTMYYGRNTSGDIAFTPEQISFPDPDGKEVVIPYTEIASIELLESPDYGKPEEGVVVNNIRLGTWHSEQMGDYVAHTAIGIDDCLLIRTSEAAFAVNYENNETTAELLEEIQKYL